MSSAPKHASDYDDVHTDAAPQAPEEHHRHLNVVKPKATPVPLWRRWLVVGLMAASVATIAASFSQPWWQFTLYAPQYPHGLHMVMGLTGVTGDVGEIDELNHYIGMTKLETVASTELHYAAWGVALVAILVFAMTLFMGRKTGKWIVAPALAFPIGFMLDCYFHLYEAGHSMDPHAAIRLPGFTPQMFGNGQIGQFMTFANPLAGFWIAVVGALLVVVATVVRQRAVCAECTQRGACGAVCVNAFVVRKEHPPTGA